VAVAPEEDVERTGELKRVLGPGLLVLLIVGDILGAGIYAVTGNIAAEVGGVAWLPFVVAFAVATLTAFAYLELVTSYPRAAGAALYTHLAFRRQFVTFLVAFTVIGSAVTSAATSSNLLAANLLLGLGTDHDGAGAASVLVVALAFMVLLALVNLRGVGESAAVNVVLTVVELAALVVVVLIGFAVMATRGVDLGRVVVFENASDRGIVAATTVATAIAFFAMVGFEDSVNMVEETRDPERTFPRVMLTGLGVALVLYVLVSVSVVVVLPLGEIQDFEGESGILVEVVRTGVPDLPVGRVFPFLTVFAVANTALINMLMASRMVYGLARQGVLPEALGRVLPGRRTPWTAIVFTTALALGLTTWVSLTSDRSVVGALSGTTGLLLLGVFAVVNVACLVLRRDPRPGGTFRAPAPVPVLGALLCAFLAGPWARDPEDWVQYRIAAVLLAVGVALWALTRVVGRPSRGLGAGQGSRRPYP
jgi:APA family basic amino acid/polyamine antiporter